MVYFSTWKSYTKFPEGAPLLGISLAPVGPIDNGIASGFHLHYFQYTDAAWSRNYVPCQ